MIFHLLQVQVLFPASRALDNQGLFFRAHPYHAHKDTIRHNSIARRRLLELLKVCLTRLLGLYRDIGEYVAALPNTEGRNNTLEQRNSKEGDE